MKFLALLVALMLLNFTYARSIHDYQELVTELKKPAIESSVNLLLGGFNKADVATLIGSHAYDLARTGVGCGAGVFGGLDTAFTIADIIQSDPTDIGVYIFAVIYSIAWWQQNGQYIDYMCSTFWSLLH